MFLGQGTSKSEQGIGPGVAYINALAVDGAGNVVLCGEFTGAVDFGGGMLDAAGDTNFSFFVVKLAPSGAHVWSRSFGDGTHQQCSAIAVDAAGNVIIGGASAGGVDFGAGHQPATAPGWGPFVAKFDPDGELIWAEIYDAQEAEVHALAVDALGNIVAAGRLSEHVDFGAGPLVSTYGRGAYVVKLDPSGDEVWSREFSCLNGSTSAVDVAVDGADSVILAGQFSGSIDLGAGLLAGAGRRDAFVVKLDSEGVSLWGNVYGDAADQAVTAVAAGADGRVLLAGDFTGEIDLGAGRLVGRGDAEDRDIFVAMLDASGVAQWSRSLGNSTWQAAAGVALEPTGNALLIGGTDDPVRLGPVPHVAVASRDVLVARFDAAGELLWKAQYGDGDGQWGTAVASTPPGHVVLAAIGRGGIDFGHGLHRSPETWSSFVARLAP
uniref:Secreted protein n=1 Tax=Sorangium cellulosum TaxID=56 RepID=A0A3S5GY68_SORCE|nr:secreted protein [Sorangium cellulosum]